MLSRRLALLSLALNLCLAGIYYVGQPTARHEESPDPLPTSLPPIQRPPPSASRSAPLHWSDIAHTNLLLYALNLRDLGCPEPIVQRIIMVEIDRLFLERWNNRPREMKFWRTGGEEYQARCAQRIRKGQLERERRALIYESLGAHWHELTFRFWDDDFFGKGIARFMGPLSAEKIEPAQAVLRKYLDLGEDLGDYLADPRLLTPAEESAVAAMKHQLYADFGQVLSPYQIDEMELRLMTFGVLDIWSAPAQFGNEFTAEEFRELLRIKKTGQNLLGFLLGDEPSDLDEAVKQHQDTQIRALLGETRYQRYQRAQDFEFRTLHRTLDNLDQPIETVWRVYDVESAATAAIKTVQQDPDLSLRTEALSAIRRETEAALIQAMGTVAADKYLRAQGGNWAKRFAELKAKE